MRTLLALGCLVLLSGCGKPLDVAAAGRGGPELDPIRFFTGHVRSWGVLENRGGEPTEVVTTDFQGTADGPDGLRMTQRLQVGDTSTTREWVMRRAGPGRYEATANDMVGTAAGEASGRAFHWHWTLALSPGNALKDVDMEQWWYLQADGSVLNRTVIRKVGLVVAEVTEHFVPDR